VATLAIAGLLSACLSSPTLDALRTDAPAVQSAAAARTAFSDRTILTYGGGHGTQVEYHAPSGEAFLWCPGNSRSVPADWEVRLVDQRAGPQICYRYPTASFNPVTRERGGDFECYSFPFYELNMVEVLAGDPFRLATGRIPFRLDRGRFSASDLQALANRREGNIVTLWRK
jgi:hypothetical protein